MQEDEETGYGYPVARNIVEKILTEMEIVQRIQQNESDISALFRLGLTPEQVDVLDISKANIVIPGTREQFDLDRILEMHDIGISELKAADLAPRNWVGTYVNGFGFLKATDFKSKMLTTEFEVGDYAPQILQQWLTMPPERGEVLLTPEGRDRLEVSPLGPGMLGDLGIGEVAIVRPPPGIPLKEQIGTNIEDIGSLKDQTGKAKTDIIDLDVRMDAAEADIEGIIGEIPVMGMPSAREILTSVLPLSIGLRTGGTESFQNWLETFNTRTIENHRNTGNNTRMMDQNFNLIIGNREMLDDHIEKNQITFDNFIAPSANFVNNFETYIAKDFQVNFLGLAAPQGTIPYHLFTEYTDPISGEYKRSVLRFQVADNVRRLLRFESDTNTRLEDIQKDVDDIKGFEPVLGIADYDSIVDHLKAREWDIGGQRAIFQAWLEEFNSRTLGNGQLIGEVTDRVGTLEGGLGDYDSCFRGDAAFMGFLDELSLGLGGITDDLDSLTVRMNTMADEIQAVMDDTGGSFPTRFNNFMKAVRNAFRTGSGTQTDMSVEFTSIRDKFENIKRKTDSLKKCMASNLSRSSIL